MQLKSFLRLMLVAIVLAGSTTAASGKVRQADLTTTLNVKLALLDRLGTDGLLVDVDSLAGTVTLDGTVDRPETKDLAGSVAESVFGVMRVDNRIRLVAAAADSSQVGAAFGEAEGKVEDAVLETRLRLALLDKMGRYASGIGTSAANGVVTLSFDRAFRTQSRRQAVGIATGIAGVSKVVAVNKT